MMSKTDEQWKKYFESAGCSIYEIIQNAIRVAALDDPKKFKIHRGRIAENLYSYSQLSCTCCGDKMDHHQSNVENTTKFKDKKSGCAKNKLQVDSHGDDLGERGTDKVEEHEHNGDGQINSLLQCNYTIQETEELNDKIEDEHDNTSHILEIKELLENSEKKSETEIIDSLQMLRIIVRSVEDLQDTNIGKTVSNLQQHGSKVGQTAKMVTGIFKKMIIKKRIDGNANLSERTKGPDPPSTVLDEEYVLPTPPMDEEFLMVNIPPVEFTTFFDELDDDGNPKISYEIDEKFHESQINPPKEKKEKGMKCEGSASSLQKEKGELINNKLINPKNSRPSHKSCETEMIHEGQRKPSRLNKRKYELQLIEDLEPFPTIKRPKIAWKLESGEKLSNKNTSRPSDTEYSSKHSGKQKLEVDVDNDTKTHKKKDKHIVNQRSNDGTRQSLGSSDDVARMEKKLENSKIKLHLGYQEHEKAKRTTKFVPVVDDVIPKDGNCRSSSQWRYNNQRNWKW